MTTKPDLPKDGDGKPRLLASSDTSGKIPPEEPETTVAQAIWPTYVLIPGGIT